MRPRRFVLRIAVIFSVVFLLLSLPWPYLARAYTTAFSAIWTTVLNISADVRKTGFVLRPEIVETGTHGPAVHHSEWSISAYVQRGGVERKVNSVDLRRASYLPCAVYLALVLSVVGSIKGRAAILRSAAGFFVLQIMPALLMIILLDQAGSMDLGEGKETALMIGYRALISSPGMGYALPALIWLTAHRKILWPQGDGQQGQGAA